MKTILVPVDLSPSSKKISAAARAFADRIGGRIVLLHVMQPPPVVANEYNAVDAAQLAVVLSAGKKFGTRKLTQLAAQVAKRGHPVKTIHETGVPGTVILDRAKSLKADYIVLGSHGHGALYDLVVGSTAHDVLKNAPCPVLVIPSAPAKRKRK